MAICEFGIITRFFYMERKRDLIISWWYASLAMNRGEIKQGFTEHVFHVLCIYISYVWVDNNCWLSDDIMPISYVTRQWFYRCLLFLQVGLQAIKVNCSSCTNNLILRFCLKSSRFLLCFREDIFTVQNWKHWKLQTNIIHKL
jgi:hypothetical protein